MSIRSLLLVVAVASVGTAAVGQEAKYRAPRTEFGRPDLRGVWNFSSDVPLERPQAFADKKLFTREEALAQRDAKTKALEMVGRFAPVEAVGLTWLDYGAQVENLRTSLITYPENGRLPKLVEGVQRAPGIEDLIAALNNGGIPPAFLAAFGGGKKDAHEDLGLAERCLAGSGSPLVPGFDNNYVQIVQSRDHVAFISEALHYAKIVPLDERPYLGEKLRSWYGDSRGHWEGDTLVVATRNFNDRTGSFAGAGKSHEKVVTERFTRTASNVLEYEATIVDPKTFQDKIVMSLPMGRTDTPLYEVACHEGNYSVPNILSAARKEDAAGPLVSRQQITLLDRNGKTVGTVGEPGGYTQAALSPDGGRVAVIRTDADTQDTQVWVYDVATGQGTPITSDAARKASPVWSPDGHQIAYVSTLPDDNSRAIFRKASDGSGREELLYTHALDAGVLTDWSVDGILSFWAGKVLYAVPVTGDRKAVALSDGAFNVRGGRFSPDGRFIAFNSDESGRFQVYVRPFSLTAGSVSSATAKSIPVSDNQAIGGIFWRHDSQEIYFLASPLQAVMAADVTTSPTFAVGKPRLLFRMPNGAPGPAQLSNVATGDGQQFVYVAQITVAQPTTGASAQR